MGDQAKESMYRLGAVEVQADLMSDEPKRKSVMPVKSARALMVVGRPGKKGEDVVCKKIEP